EPIKLLSFFEEFISECETGKRLTPDGTRLEENSIKPFRTVLSHLQNFETANKKSIPLDKFNQEYHDGFLEYLEVEHEMSRNTSSKYMMCLLQVIKSAVKKKLFSPVLLGQLEFATARENSDNIYLNEKELKEIMNLKEFNSKMEAVVRDLFIVGCYTGLRFSNYSNLGTENIRNGLIEVVQVKTKEKLEIEIHPFVNQILKKYKNKLPKSPTNQEFNRTLKDICQRIPMLDVPFEKLITKGRRKTIIGKKKWEMIMTHTARRSFCTNMYNRGVPVMTIMAFSGHKTEKNFRKYIKSTNEDHRKIIRGFW
ncbi:MAG: site-specific integrase, partial [Bacteroidetes bacterium]|nr:site-specific integrase [Bacteroidota bacterium]